jgi:ubiquinone/menaquinone biosynthesis C-methylase UbiE
MNLHLLKETIEGIDIYILDQILKDSYQSGDKILDVGCGNGRNLKWFYNTGFEVHGTDINNEKLQYCKELYPLQKDNFIFATAEKMPYESNYFDHIICNAVLHFAVDLSQYLNMFQELLRILKPQGILFIRTASNFGIENQVAHINKGIYRLPDCSSRFLLTQSILDDLLKNNSISLVQNIKTTIVHNNRSMTTLVIKKYII